MRAPITTIQINGHIWLFNDNNEATGYLVTGRERALVIDTMNGYEDVCALVRRLTDLPVMVVNTHGHPDHIFGNVYFSEAYIHPADEKLAGRFYQMPEFQKAAGQAGLVPARWRYLQAGDVLSLGGLDLEVFHVPGHTPGSIVLLDRQDRLLFSGDTLAEQEWLQLEESIPAADYLRALDALEPILGQFDAIYGGHTRREPYPAEFFSIHRKAVEEVARGRRESDVPYTWFGGTDWAHPYGPAPRRICYRREQGPARYL